LDKYPKVFEVPVDLPPSKGEHDHRIPLFSSSQPPNVHPYRYPFSQENEIKKIVHELPEARVILPSTIPYSSSVLMVLKKEGPWCMCPDFHALNELTIKYKFPILVIGVLLD
jgi:hypothetical protein